MAQGLIRIDKKLDEYLHILKDNLEGIEKAIEDNGTYNYDEMDVIQNIERKICIKVYDQWKSISKGE